MVAIQSVIFSFLHNFLSLLRAVAEEDECQAGGSGHKLGASRFLSASLSQLSGISAQDQWRGPAQQADGGIQEERDRASGQFGQQHGSQWQQLQSW